MNSSVTVLIRSTWQDSLVSLEPRKSLFDKQLKSLLEPPSFISLTALGDPFIGLFVALVPVPMGIKPIV
jgi:hypothetical protein